MREPGAAHVVPALPDSGLVVQSAETQPFGERYAEPEVSGLAIAFDIVDEIGHHDIVVVEPEGVRMSSAAVSEAGRFAMAEENASCTGSGGRNAGRMLGYGAGSFFSRSAKGFGILSKVRITPVKRSAG